jgi:DNA-directed RNA polymerase specialized sigma24 family protein
VPLVDDYHLNKYPAPELSRREPDELGSSSAGVRADRQRASRQIRGGGSAARERVTEATGDSNSALLRRAQFLRDEERLLLELAIRSDLSVRQIGRLKNVPPGTISRRVQRLCARLRDPMVNWLIDPAACTLPPEHRQLAIEHFVQGHSSNELAEKHMMRAARVRQMLDQVRGWHRAITSL